MTVVDEPDEVLVQRTLRGDTNAYDRLVRRHGVRLRRFIQRFVSDQDKVEDIYIEAWGRAFNRLDTFRAADAQFTTWLFQIARNLARNVYRSEVRRRTESLETGGRNSKDGETYGIEIVDEDSDPNKTIPEAMRREEMHERLREAILRLNPTLREALVLYHIEEKGYTEIAALLGIREGAVRTRVCRAVEKLRGELGGRFPEMM